MRLIRWFVAITLISIYGVITTSFFFDWSRLFDTWTSLGRFDGHSIALPLAIYCLLSGGAVMTLLSVLAAFRQSTVGSVVAGGLFPVEVALAFVLGPNLAYWLAMKVLLLGVVVVVVRMSRGSVPNAAHPMG